MAVARRKGNEIKTKGISLMTPKTTRESIISLEGHITGLKRDMHSLKTNDLVHIHSDLEKLGGKIDKIYWVLLATVGAVAFQLINLLVKTI